ncbi:gfo/Idh/MocA family oxidoreductase, partial [Bacteroidota bacterium]
KRVEELSINSGAEDMLLQTIEYFRTGIVPVKPEETLELFAFMKAADESKLNGGSPINIEALIQKATRQAKELI